MDSCTVFPLEPVDPSVTGHGSEFDVGFVGVRVRLWLQSPGTSVPLRARVLQFGPTCMAGSCWRQGGDAATR